MLGKDYDGQHCALASALEVVGERWTLLIVRDALFGVRRYSDFVARLDIPRAVLSARLKDLVDHGVLVRRADPGRAGRHVYDLTPAGQELWPAVHALLTWGSEHRRRSAYVYRHAGCGTELAAGAWGPAPRRSAYVYRHTAGGAGRWAGACCRAGGRGRRRRAVGVRPRQRSASGRDD